ncbi:unnamed protein product [Prorocentrum cordatum]|uniref:RanBD1 domain-containing protein n=1 Tax=Prorocentrum cordatum TaxID=2364126 RepID=A0ABN9XGW4_9DINO|nr:unnamed protein product [Polarella glacialis]
MMRRAELEALGSGELQQLITEAVAVLAQRALSASGAPAPRPPAGAPALFSFGASSAADSPPPSIRRRGPGGKPAISFSSPAASAPQSGGLFSLGAAGGAAPVPSIFSFSAGSAGGGGTSGSLFAPPARGGGGEQEEEDGAGDDDAAEAEEEVSVVPGWTPSITLEVVDGVTTGEEREEQLYCQRSKLYRWKDRRRVEGAGAGGRPAAQGRTAGRVRFLMRRRRRGSSSLTTTATAT